jgi:hypothetical protein
MFLQTSFLVFSSTVHTRLTSADPNTDTEKASNAIDIINFILFSFKVRVVRLVVVPMAWRQRLVAQMQTLVSVLQNRL